MKKLVFMLCVLALSGESLNAQSVEPPQVSSPLAWPAITQECRPWAYNWQMAGAVDEKNMAKELARYHEAGLGGIHVIPIYGAKGFEEQFTDFLSPKWMRNFAFTVSEANRLGMGVDLSTGSGWCFGGPTVTKQEAGLLIRLKTDAAGTAAPSIVADKYGPKVKRAGPGGTGFMLNPLYGQAMQNYLKRFSEAFPQDGKAVLPRAMYHDSYEYNTQWAPDFPEQFEKRRGYRLQDHAADLFDESGSERAARVKADYRETVSDIMIEDVFPRWIDWCRERKTLTRYQAHGSPANLLDLYALADVPETEMFGRGNRDPLVSGLAQHFSEQGDRDPLVAKFASSAAHTSGKKLVSAETGTWMAEHFCETLEEMKCFVDLLFVSGVNHLFYHGCCYSPDEAPWPGWLFYATTEMNPRNAIWRDVPTLNAYVARCQSILQSGKSDNDVLIYWPIHDFWSEAKAPLTPQLVIHNRGQAWFGSQTIGKVAEKLWNRGFTFDYVSDRQLAAAKIDAKSSGVALPGGAYKVIVVPETKRIPVETFRKMLDLAEAGAFVIFQGPLPQDVPGLNQLEERRAELKKLQAKLVFVDNPQSKTKAASIGKGKVLIGDVDECLAEAKISRETLTDHDGLIFIRRSFDGGRHYFIANQGEKPLDGFVNLACEAATVEIMDPMSGAAGLATSRSLPGGGTMVYLQLAPGESVILRAFENEVASGPKWKYVKPIGEPTELVGTWSVKFIDGGPTLPKSFETEKLASWTKCDDAEADRFAGTALYTLHFDAPKGDRFLLDLGRVCKSARVRVNGKDVGVRIMAPYRVVLDSLKTKDNVLEVEVTNLSANRLRDLDRRGVPWRTFYDANVLGVGYKPLNAAEWPLFESGLLGPVTLQTITEPELRQSAVK